MDLEDDCETSDFTTKENLLNIDQQIIKFFSTSDDNEKEEREVIKWIDLLTQFKDKLLNLDLSEALKKLADGIINFVISVLKSPYTIPKRMFIGFMGAPPQFKLFFIIAGMGFIGTVYPLIVDRNKIFTADPPNSNTTPTDEKKKEIKYRMAQRATFASLVASLFMGTFNYAIDSVLNVSGATSTAFIGFLLGNTFGYILDLVFSTEDGYYKVMTGDWVGATKDAFGMLSSGTFTRFILTVLLDTFISSIIFTILYENIKERFVWARENESFVNAMLSTMIGVITFQVYTNKTRLSYAYPDISDKGQWMDKTLLSFVTILSGLIFVVTPKMFKYYQNPDGSTFAVIPKYGVEGVESPIVKTYMVLFTIILIMIMYFMGWDEPNVTLPPSKMETYMGRGIFAFMTIFTVYMTTQTAVNTQYSWFFNVISVIMAGVPFLLG